MTASTPISDNDFAQMMTSVGLDGAHLPHAVAVAVSGGGDSMALTVLLDVWCRAHSCALVALTVDHGLRPESCAETEMVHKMMNEKDVRHCILRWEGDKPKTKIQEEARAARYRLMGDFCKAQGIDYLLTAHHGDDQIETILFRLCKGSGLDGLVGMRARQETPHHVTLLRPLLPVSHQDLIATCKDRGWDWIEDPSNHNDRFARVRLRGVLDVLKGEGLTPARIAAVSAKLERAVNAINQDVGKQYKNLIKDDGDGHVSISYDGLCTLPDEIGLRLIAKIITQITPQKNYPVRAQDVERLWERLKSENFKGATLGGCMFRRMKGQILVKAELPKQV